MTWSKFVDRQIPKPKSNDMEWIMCYRFFGRAMRRRGKFPIPVKVQPWERNPRVRWWHRLRPCSYYIKLQEHLDLSGLFLSKTGFDRVTAYNNACCRGSCQGIAQWSGRRRNMVLRVNRKWRKRQVNRYLFRFVQVCCPYSACRLTCNVKLLYSPRPAVSRYYHRASGNSELITYRDE